MKQLNFLLALIFLMAAGCKPGKIEPVAENAAVKIYDARGIVQQISPDRRTITIKHEAIPGYMGAMTMDFSLKGTNELNGISPNDEITFKLAVTQTDDWIEAVRLVAHHIGDVTNNVFVFHVASEELKVGDAWPDAELTAANGSKIHFSDFRGRALAFTFFFTSCPLPDFCPRMNKNFAEARKILLVDANAPTNWELLSISFDPDFDTPEILTGYANFYRGADTNRWLFAVAPTNTLAQIAPKVDLHFWRENGSITHNLRTVVLDPNEKIFREFDNNDWTPQELAEAIRAAAKMPAR